MNKAGEKCVEKSPANTTVAAQVQMIKELINQGIKSLTISVNGDEGFDEIIALAKQKGIKVISVDSALKASQRETHVIPTSQQEVGQDYSLARASMGLSQAALRAGIKPKMMPMADEQARATTVIPLE